MTTPARAAIYARISLDAEGDGKAVKRQVEDCEQLADRLGWTIADTYQDSDISAYSGKHRPEYERMLSDMGNGSVDGVLVYNLDRLTRRPIEFEQFNDIATKANIPLRCVTGDMDLGTDDGLLMGRIQAAFAAKESGAKSRRQKRKNDERAAAGLPHGGYRRPYGFDDDKITHNPDEVAVIRTLADRLLAGESLRSLATWLQDQGIRTVSGGPWRTHVIRAVLTSPRTAGLREARGEIVGPAIWKPIVTLELRDRILAAFDERTASGRRTPRRYLLSGLLRCGRCGKRLYSARRRESRRYVCQSGPDHGGCGHLTVVADPLEILVADAVLYRLDTPDLAEALAGRARQDKDTARLMDAVSADREQLAVLTAHYADRRIPINEWLAARTIIEDRMKVTEKRLRRATSTVHLTGVIGQGQALRTQWATLNLSRQFAIVKAILDHAVILPGKTGARTLDPERVKPIWRL